MTNDVAKKQMCIQMRSGVEIWVDEEKAKPFQGDLESGMRGFAGFGGRSMNPADIVGVFYPEDMESATRRKNGEWKCHAGNWHMRGEKCNCLSAEAKRINEQISAAIKNCGKCEAGWIKGKNGMRRCLCVKPLIEALDKMTSRADN